ncbi:MAG: phenylacetate--CoA ligase family protein [Gemmatimonadales bacterium]
MSIAAAFWMAADAASTFAALRLDATEVDQLARRRLSNLLFHAAIDNPFYSRRLQDVGIEWADPILQLDPYRALGALPPVSKQELRRAGSKAFDRGCLGDDWLSSASSGSTGEPFRVYYEPRAWARLRHLVKLRARRACGVRATDRVALLEATAPERSLPFARWSRISVLQPPSAVAGAIAAFSPDVLYGLPSALLEAARVLQLRRDQLHVRAVFTSGELLDRTTRDAVSRAYEAPVYNVYGTSETKEIAWECPHGGMHLNHDVVKLEVLNDSDRPVPAGTEGELVATVLVNRAMPLLRYRTGDRGILLPGLCSCGRTSPLLGVVTGREADVLVLRGGQRISPYALTCALERVSGVVRYQISQLDPARVRIRAMLEAAVDRDHFTTQVRDVLRFEVASFLDADVEFVERFPSGPRAKFRVVEPLA